MVFCFDFQISWGILEVCSYWRKKKSLCSIVLCTDGWKHPFLALEPCGSEEVCATPYPVWKFLILHELIAVKIHCTFYCTD